MQGHPLVMSWLVLEDWQLLSHLMVHSLFRTPLPIRLPAGLLLLLLAQLGFL
jgi:hypothetical protein